MALVLSRFEGQRIMVGDDIVITLISSRNGVAKIGVDAPKEIRVDREEIFDKIKREKEIGK